MLLEQVRSGDGCGTKLFELGVVMSRRKFYPTATKNMLQVYNALGISYILDGKVDKGYIAQLENTVKLQHGYVTAWNNFGDAYEKNKDLKSALKAFEEVLEICPQGI